MDFLLYAARTTRQALCTCITTTIPTTSCAAGVAVTAAQGTAEANSWTTCGTTYSCFQTCRHLLDETPWNTTAFGIIPTLPGGNTSFAGINPATSTEYSGLKVCATNLDGGACCLWTVPANTSIARIQLWGGGSGTGSGCCCGGAPGGITGAFASIIIPVVPGCQYSLCAGPGGGGGLWSSRAPGPGSTSYATGFGLSSYCAIGGQGVNLYCRIRCDAGTNWCGRCRWTAPDCASVGGACICNSGWDFCFTNSCASCGNIGPFVNCDTRFNGTYNGPCNIVNSNICLVYGTQVAGICGSQGVQCFDSNFYGFYKHPPIYGFESVSECCQIANNGNMCGGLCCNNRSYNYLRYPGAGGAASFMFNGCTTSCDPSSQFSCGGDNGRGGMVCVTFA